MSVKNRVRRVGAISFKNASAAARYLLKRSKLSQSEIARRLKISAPCVCQLASAMK